MSVHVLARFLRVYLFVLVCSFIDPYIRMYIWIDVQVLELVHECEW